MSWLFSSSCSCPLEGRSSQATLSLFSQAQEWIAYILFSQCPQHSAVAIVDLLFILATVSFDFGFARTRKSPAASFAAARASKAFFFALISGSAISAASVGMVACQVWDGFTHGWMGALIRETLFLAVNALAWTTSSLVLLNLRKQHSSVQATLLPAWWGVSFLLSVLQFASSILRLSASSGLAYDSILEVFDVYALAKFPFACFLMAMAWKGDAALHASGAYTKGKLSESLLSHEVGAEAEWTSPFPAERSSFTEAGFFSRATFSWLNPLLSAGASKSLEEADVPALAACDRAEETSRLLQLYWPKAAAERRPLTMALVKTFWRPLLFTGFLQALRSPVMYAGPLLISSFTSFATEGGASAYDGYSLVFLLLVAKVVEVFTYHHFNFQSYRMGNNMRSAVIATLYQKSLRLSSSSRRKHGVSHITNYMVVDAQQISDSCLQLHQCWSIPLQVGLGMLLLWRDVGISSVAALATMVLIGALTTFISKSQTSHMGDVMRMRDIRMRSVTEVLFNMKVLKLQAWEEKFREQVEQHRKKELNALTGFVVMAAANMFIMWNTITLVSVITYVTAILLDVGLTTSKIFTAASIFRIIQEPVRFFPQAINTVSQLLVSLERLNAFMLSAELDRGAVIRSLEATNHPITVEEGFFSWDEDQDSPTLRHIDLEITKGSLVTVVGTIGSGKSSLLAALLGEMVKVSGLVKVTGSIAYVPQTAWIQNATIMDNILFGSPLECDRYKKVVHACGLEPDFAAMDHGDQTEIGEKGINLSGGQKQRIQLARAVYQNSDVYLLDDVFSAVDAHTGSHLFQECLLGLLKGKTVMLVTHQVEFLKGADLVVVMREGAIVQSGKYNEILNAGTDFAGLVAAHNEAMNSVDGEGNPKEHSQSDFGEKPLQRLGSENRQSREGLLGEITLYSGSFERPSRSESFLQSTMPKGSSKLVEEEQRESGRVSWSILWLYLTKAFGWATVVVLVLSQSIWQALLVTGDYWLAGEIPVVSGMPINKKRVIPVYVLVNAAACIALLGRVAVVAAFGVKTSQLFFLGMLRSIVRAPMSFFDTTPSGRILSRFSADQMNLDFPLHYFLGGCLGCLISTLGIIIVVVVSTWPIIFLLIPLGWLFYHYQNFFMNSSREITRLDSITKAPVIYHFSETVAGIETIRCFRKEDSFARQNLDFTNVNMKMDFCNNTATEWLGLRLESMGSAILCTAALLIVVLPSNIVKSETIGLALSYALGLNVAMFWNVWLACTVENKMISVERIRQFSTLPAEAPLSITDCVPASSWPSKGKIETIRLKLRYRPSTPLVLKGVSFSIEGGQKVGIVGRTGSGKSTLILALFRLVEPSGGQILIDDMDISTIGLHDLRSRLGIIPQDPVLFEGTVRRNLDPLGIYTDEELWRGLEKCQLAHIIAEKPEKLEASVAESGGNWSVGQRQLFCFGRALLKRSRVLFLDEATASVDAQTDAIIQRIIRQEFEECSVVSIAHRIPTVMDSHKVLVMQDGRVSEFDSPSKLLQSPTSLFSSLVHEYSTRAAD